MAAPSATTRETPDGIPLRDGFSTKVTFESDPDISFWEREVTPPGIDGGEPVPQTTMHNLIWRTMRPRFLKTLTPMSLTAAYDPDLYDEALAIINVETTVTVTFTDLSTLAFFGYLQKFDPGNHVEGTQPDCGIVIIPTNWDHASSVEAGPTMTEIAGT